MYVCMYVYMYVCMYVSGEVQLLDPPPTENAAGRSWHGYYDSSLPAMLRYVYMYVCMYACMYVYSIFIKSKLVMK